MQGHLSARLLLLVAAGLGAAACSGGAAPAPAPPPPPTKAWSAVPAQPAWVAAVPPRAGWLRFVTSGRSNLVSIATGSADTGPAEAAARVRRALTGVVEGETLEAATAAAEAATEPVWRSYLHATIDPRPVPGNTLCDAWALWETPVDAVVDALPPETRAAARTALTR